MDQRKVVEAVKTIMEVIAEVKGAPNKKELINKILGDTMKEMNGNSEGNSNKE
ncbi:hypothetical protein [Heliorestis acidaminivorans]|uniref:hypothetical protein n=1 Tax=Heliorestis acidaminivorans TaxID=553427 RepID=UPI001478F742|nr:hypothetical protein [Heliorestis acidaminivorans]